MSDSRPYSIEVGEISQQELDLLECLVRIDQREALDARAGDLLERLIEAGLVDSFDGDLSLTVAGIERCRSLQHRIAGDSEAAKVIAGRGLEFTGDGGD
jgi:hypothetical protein